MIVKSTLPAGRVALWETHPAHPNGEVFIADQEPVEVGATEQVHKRLADGWLVEVKPEKPVKPPEPVEPPEMPEPAEDKPKRRSR